MKKIDSLKRTCITLLLVAVSGMLLFSCKKDKNIASPVISQIRAITPAPNDSTLTKALPGQLVVIQGSNLATVNAVYFNGVSATFNSALVADNNIVVYVPSSIDFSKIAASDKNTIKVVTTAGSVIYNFPVLPPPPVVTSVSNEYALPGTTLTLYGQYLYLINKVSFTGGDATGIQSSSDGTSLTLTIPATATAGNIVVYGQGGTATYISYNDKVTNMACNFDNINTYQYYSGNLTNSATLFPGNQGNYVELSTTSMSANDFGWYNGGRSINLNTVQWVPVANLSDPVTNWVLKFEIYIKTPWKSGSLLIRRDETGGWGYVARYEPWKTAASGVVQTTGWVTVVIPFSQFKLPSSSGVNGLGNSVTTMSALFNTMGPSLTASPDVQGKRGMSFMLINDVATASGAVDMAIDNIRFSKIK